MQCQPQPSSAPSGMRTLLVFLLLGAIVNVAVAWGCVRVIGKPPTEVGTISYSHKEWLRPSNWDWEKYPLDSYIHRNRGVRVEQLFLRGVRGHAQIAAEIRAGFPMHSLAGWFTPNSSAPREWDVNNPPYDSVGFWAYDPQFQSSISTVLPLIPLWPGFAVNTLLYAVMMWGAWLLVAPFALRRRTRIKRGLCAKCAYDLRGCASQNCPECGTAVPP